MKSDAMQPGFKRRRGPGRGSTTTPAERTAIQALAISGMSAAAIARHQGRSRKTITRGLTGEEFYNAPEMARSALALNAENFAQDWVTASRVAARNGRHDAARDALLGIKAIEPPTARAQQGGFTVQIGVLLPGLGPQASTTAEVIDADSVTE